MGLARIWLALLVTNCVVMATPNYRIGRGIADCTGPVAEINMMGYAKGGQDTSGIHLRLYSRAFIIANRDGSNPIVFVSIDVGMISQLLKMEVVGELKKLYRDQYTDENVMLSATHTHSGPGAFHQYVLFDVTSKGFYGPSLDALVQGVVMSIQMAHKNLAPGDIYIASGTLEGSNINRSPAAYMNNPPEERARYPNNTDTEMLLLSFRNATGSPIGMINWFAVHPTSMNNTNTLISSDNKGYASILFEADMNDGRTSQDGIFVGAFAQSNLGDVSPNTKGPHCLDTGKPCDMLQSTCGDGKVQNCIASGPGHDMFESTKIIAHNQYKKAKELFKAAKVKLSGPVDHRMMYRDMTNVTVDLNGKKVHTCKPAMGYSFAAGTTDGPGAFDFKQGDTEGNLFWNLVRDVIKKPSLELQDCHAPKPILLPTGEMSFPYKWQPDIVDFQVFRIGQLVILGVPGEFSTMSGRRAREDITKTLVNLGFPNNTTAVIAGLSNSYSDYITTYEEYQVQRYEGASTIYGPHTLAAMIQTLRELAVAMAKGVPVHKGTPPSYWRNKLLDFITPVVFDAAPYGKSIGDVYTQPRDVYKQGETSTAVFHAGNPRNSDPRSTMFLEVQELQVDYTWKGVVNDATWETKFHWERVHTLLGTSHAHLTWAIPSNQKPGTYRFVHRGHSMSRSIIGKKTISSYIGYSNEFKVVSAQ